MIPKKIHYCWFGKGERPLLVKKCMETWSSLSDYEIHEWNEDNIGILGDSEYLREVIKKRKWAFASDYIRLKALYQYGGIYLDTDVEVTGCFDQFLAHEMFLGFIYDCSIGTAVIGSKAGHPIISDLLDLYDALHWDDNFIFFTLKNYPELRLKNNNDIFTLYFLEKFPKFKLNNSSQVLENVVIYPKEYFEVQPIIGSGYSIHRCAGSWIRRFDGKNVSIKNGIKKRLDKILSILPIINGEALLTHILYKKNLSRKPFYSHYLKHREKINRT